MCHKISHIKVTSLVAFSTFVVVQPPLLSSLYSFVSNVEFPVALSCSRCILHFSLPQPWKASFLQGASSSFEEWNLGKLIPPGMATLLIPLSGDRYPSQGREVCVCVCVCTPTHICIYFCVHLYVLKKPPCVHAGPSDFNSLLQCSSSFPHFSVSKESLAVSIPVQQLFAQFVCLHTAVSELLACIQVKSKCKGGQCSCTVLFVFALTVRQLSAVLPSS